jgi:signal transduction histidine kinase
MLGPTQEALSSPERALSGDDLETVYRNQLRLLKLVNTLLDFSRLESGQVRAQFEPIDLSRYTAELASMFDSAVERAGLTLEIECPPLPEPVYVDREMWAKIVLNLLSNALKFTFEGGVTVRMAAEPDGARLTVADSGIGIPEDELPRLFERFHRVAGARSRSHEGSGIGLALVAELAELHGGAASVTSRRGEGSAFSVIVPFGASHLAEDDLRREPDAEVNVRQQAEGFLVEAMRWLGADEDGASGVADADAPRVSCWPA